MIGRGTKSKQHWNFDKPEMIMEKKFSGNWIRYLKKIQKGEVMVILLKNELENNLKGPGFD